MCRADQLPTASELPHVKHVRQGTHSPRSMVFSRYSASRQPREGWVQACELVFAKTSGEVHCLGDPRGTQNGQRAQKPGSRLTLHFPPLPPPLPPSPPPCPSEPSLHLEGQCVLRQQVTAPPQHEHQTNQVSWNDPPKNLATDDVQGKLPPRLVRATGAFGG